MVNFFRVHGTKEGGRKPGQRRTVLVDFSCVRDDGPANRKIDLAICKHVICRNTTRFFYSEEVSGPVTTPSDN